MPRLVVVGNGFDRGHCVPSTYTHFKEYLLQSNSDLHDLIEELSDKNVWNDFEENLANLDLRHLLDRLLDEHIPHENYRPNDASNRHGVRCIEEELEKTGRLLICDLERELVEWATTIKDLAEEQRYNLLTDDYVISFNYTSTVENLYTVSSKRIYYIHKKVADYYLEEDCPNPLMWEFLHSSQWRLIFGHGSRTLPIPPPVLLPSMDIGYDSNNDHVALTEAYDKIYSCFYRTRKPVDAIMPDLEKFLESTQDIDHVIIIGHSLSRVDQDYFRKLSDKLVRPMKYSITYHGAAQKDGIKANASTFVRDGDTVEFLDTTQKTWISKPGDCRDLTDVRY
jgi:hypothetical protein